MNRKQYLDKIRYEAFKYFGKEQYNVWRKRGWSVEKIYAASKPNGMFLKILKKEGRLHKKPKKEIRTWLFLKNFKDEKNSINLWHCSEQRETLEFLYSKSCHADVILELETGKVIKNRFGRTDCSEKRITKMLSRYLQ